MSSGSINDARQHSQLENENQLTVGVKPDDNDCRVTIQKLLKVTLPLMLLSLVVCEGFSRFFVFLSKPACSPNPQYDAKYLVADTVSGANDNITLFGDSLIKQGLYPELITSKLQSLNERVRVVNLATSGGSQEDAICYLEYLRGKGIKPKLVILILTSCIQAIQRNGTTRTGAR